MTGKLSVEASIVALQVELKHLDKSVTELKQQIKELQAQLTAMQEGITEVNRFVFESRLGRKWIIGTIFGAATLGALIDTILKWLRVY